MVLRIHRKQFVINHYGFQERYIWKQSFRINSLKPGPFLQPNKDVLLPNLEIPRCREIGNPIGIKFYSCLGSTIKFVLVRFLVQVKFKLKIRSEATDNHTVVVFLRQTRNIDKPWVSKHMPCKVWDKITYPFTNFNGSTVELWEWLNNFISHIIMDVIILSWLE